MKETKILRIGMVSSVNPETATVKVVFVDMDNMVSADLPVIFPQVSKNKAYAMPDVGSNVVCVFMEQGVGDGFCLGCFYTPGLPPPTADQNKVQYTFEDGTYIEYDRSTHKLIADINGDAEIKGKKVSIDCNTLSGSCEKGDISGEAVGIACKTLTASCVNGSITGQELALSGNITLSGNIVLSGNVECPGYCTCKG